MEEQIKDVKFQALRNALYHTARRSALETMNRLINLLIIIAGAAAVSDLLSPWVDMRWFAFVATVAGALQLVCDFGGRSRTHEFLQRRYYEVLATIERSPTATDGDICQWNADLMQIYADEPPVMRALDSIAYNNAADALDRDMRIKVGWWQSLMRNIMPFNNWSEDWVRVARLPDA